MNDEIKSWLTFAEENHRISVLARENRLFNSCLQNAQQAAEKSLKALCLARGLALKRTHSIRELRDDLKRTGLELDLSDDDCELLDSIYLPSKYPLGSALPSFEPDDQIARRCLEIAGKILALAKKLLLKAY